MSKIQTEKEKEEKAEPPPRRGWVSLISLYMGLFLFSIILCAGLLVTVLQDRTLTLPKTIQTKLNVFLNTEPDFPEISFSSAEIGFSAILNPKLVLEGVQFSDDLTGSGVRLGKLEVVFDGSKFITGVVAPKSTRLNGAVLDVTRKIDGSFDLGFDVSSGITTTLSVDEVFKKIEGFFVDEGYRSLEKGEIDQVTVNYTDQLNKRAWTFDGGRLRAERDDGRVTLRIDLALLSGGDEPATVGIGYEFSTDGIGELSAEIHNIPAGDLGIQAEALTWLNFVNGNLSGSLRSTRINGEFDELNALLDFGQGELLAGKGNKNIPYSKAKTYFSYSPKNERLDIDLILIESDWGKLSASGYSLLLSEGEDGHLSDGMILDLEVDSADLQSTPWWAENVKISEATSQIKITYSPLQVDVGQIQARVNGANIIGSGRASLMPAGWISNLNVEIPSLSSKDLLKFWPLGQKIKSRKWFEQNVNLGTFKNLRINANKNVGREFEVASSFSFENANIKFMKHMPVISNGSGYGMLEGSALTVVSQGGHVKAPEGGRIALKGSVFKIEDTRVPSPLAKFDVQGSGSISAAMSLLNQKPFEIANRSKMNIKDVSGHVTFDAKIKSVLTKAVKLRDVRYDVTGVLQNVRTGSLIPKKIIVSKSLNFKASPEKVQIFGDGTVSEVPFSGRWTQPLGVAGLSSQVAVQIEISETSLRSLNILFPKEAISGKANGDLILDIQKGSPILFDLKSDLVGVGIDVPALSWEKETTVPADFEISGSFSKPITINQFKLKSEGLSTWGDMAFDDMGLTNISLNDLKVGKWLSSDVVLQRRDPGKPMQITLSGGALDLRNLPVNKSTGATAPIIANLNTVRISKNLALTNVSATFLGGEAVTGEFSGNVNDGTPLTGNVSGRGDNLRLDLFSDDAGGVLRDSGLLRQASGGYMDLGITPAASGWNADMKISNVRIKDAPQIAQLLSAISVVGLPDQIDGKGIFFNTIESEFNIENDEYTVYRSSAVGPSLGLSLDGYINTKRKLMDLQGVLSPFYLLNGIGAFLTRRGEGLIGFNFNLKGPTAQPIATVNPLSAFTPGMFREIFRRPAPKQN